MTLKAIYLVLAAAGLGITWYYNLLFMAAGGTLGGFVHAPEASLATQSLAWDLLIAAVTGSVWMLHEGWRIGIRHAWIYIVLTFVVAFAFALPLFLFHREMKRVS